MKFGALNRLPGQLLDWCWARSVCLRCRKVFTYRDHGQVPPRFCGQRNCNQERKQYDQTTKMETGRPARRRELD